MLSCLVSGPLGIAWLISNSMDWRIRFAQRFNQENLFWESAWGSNCCLESEEFGIHKGLGIIQGKVRRFPVDQGLKVPHMGWNNVTLERPCPLFQGIPNGSFWYFVHSFYADPSDKAVVTTMTDYGATFVSSIWRENVVACQFHPEKSQSVGLRLMKNFGSWHV